MGFNQRQAGGKFTRDEVTALIEQFEQEADAARDDVQPGDAAPPAQTPTPRAAPRTAARDGEAAGGTTTSPSTPSKVEQALRKVPSSMLAAELQRRGWVVMEP